MAALTFDPARGRRTRRAAGIIVALLAFALAMLLQGAAAESAKAQRAKTMGPASKGAKSGCPGRACQAVGRLTGFQVRAGKRNPFVVPRPGHLVAWSIDLTRKPKSEQRKFFGKLYSHKPFGTNPSARIAILKQRKGNKFRLKSHSPAVGLKGHFGERPIFTLGKPLRVAKGDIVALTIPTWTSAFAVGLPTRQTAWRASRARSRCDVGTTRPAERKNLRKSKPQEKEGSTRTYGCTYRGARLLYWGYYVPRGGGGDD